MWRESNWTERSHGYRKRGKPCVQIDVVDQKPIVGALAGVPAGNHRDRKDHPITGGVPIIRSTSSIQIILIYPGIGVRSILKPVDIPGEKLRLSRRIVLVSLEARVHPDPLVVLEIQKIITDLRELTYAWAAYM